MTLQCFLLGTVMFMIVVHLELDGWVTGLSFGSNKRAKNFINNVLSLEVE